jgi:hypothetical protein
MVGNPRRNTHRMVPELKEFARDRCMLRQVRVAGKKVACGANNRKCKGPQRGKASVNFGASSRVFTSVQRLIKFEKVREMRQPEIRGFRVINARDEIVSPNMSVLYSVKVLQNEIEISKNDSVGPISSVLTYKLKDTNLLQGVSGIKIHSKDVQAPKLRVTPKVQSTRILIKRAASERGATIQESFLNGNQATSRVMVKMAKKDNVRARHVLIRHDVSFSGGSGLGQDNKGVRAAK